MLRDFQVTLRDDIYAAWQGGARNVMAVSPTGSGKTVVLGHILKSLNQPAVAIAHRQELVAQLALALNREEVPHAIIAPKSVCQQIVSLEMDNHGRTFYAPSAQVKVAGVDTLIRRSPNDAWFKRVQIAVVDEGHHVTKENKWSKAMEMFPNAYGLFPTAHALRADGLGLGRVADGLADALVVGPSCRALIDRGFLTDYRLVCPPSDVDVTNVPVGSTGDFNAPRLREAVHKSKTIVGDVVLHYLKFAAGKLGVTFAVDIEAATEIAAAYRNAGVPAEVITANTPIAVRGQLMRQFRARDLLQLVSVDVLGEGVDVPAIEVVSMARHTASFQLYSQQFGRALRIMVSDADNARWDTLGDAGRLATIAASVKPNAIVIDHVNNYQRHGLPDTPREYTLTRRERRSRSRPDDAIPLRACLNPECLQPYEAVLPQCPYCGIKPVPQRRSAPEFVDGDLIELDPETLRALRGEINRIDDAVAIPKHLVGTPAATAIQRNHRARQQAQHTLRDAMALWAGWQTHLGRSLSESYRRFWHTFGVDVATAQTLNANDAMGLEVRLRDILTEHNIVEASV